MHFLVFMDELLTVQFVLGCVIRIDEFFPCPEYFRQCLRIVILDS